jgi:hypothetical protein
MISTLPLPTPTDRNDDPATATTTTTTMIVPCDVGIMEPSDIIALRGRNRRRRQLHRGERRLSRPSSRLRRCHRHHHRLRHRISDDIVEQKTSAGDADNTVVVNTKTSQEGIISNCFEAASSKSSSSSTNDQHDHKRNQQQQQQQDKEKSKVMAAHRRALDLERNGDRMWKLGRHDIACHDYRKALMLLQKNSDHDSCQHGDEDQDHDGNKNCDDNNNTNKHRIRSVEHKLNGTSNN